MSEKNSLVSKADVVDVVAEHLLLGQSDPPMAGRSNIGKSTQSPCEAEGVNSLLTPVSEESPIPVILPQGSYKAFVSTAKIPPQTKVAIPRNTNKPIQPATGRISKACSSCRSRKVKCSGEHPSCRQCRELDLTCRYPMSWREEMKREANSNSAVVKEYQSFVGDLLRTADPATREWIITTLKKYQISQNFSVDAEDGLSSKQENANLIHSMAVDQASLSFDKTHSGACTNINLDKELGQTVTPPSTGVHNDAMFEDSSESIWGRDFVNNIYNGTNGSFDQKYNLPPRAVAENLFNDYLNDIHPEFPIINKQLFRIQYRDLWQSAQHPGDKWLAILNMMFAIAALYTQRRKPQWNDRDYDHLVYFTRAKLLSMTEEDVFNRPNLQQIQIEALFGFYLLASEQFDKAWRISALAARAAIDLEADLRATNNSSLSPRETRFRLWWCLYTFEQVLGLISCHPTSISYDRSSIPYPSQAQEYGQPETRQSSSTWSSKVRPKSNILNDISDDFSPHLENDVEPTNDAFFVFSCRLAVIVEDIGSKLYGLRTSPEKERVASDLLHRIDSWRESLPSNLNFHHVSAGHKDQHKIRLAFHFYGARIALARPWIFLRDMLEYNHTSYNMAHVAIQSARSLLELVSGELDVATLCETCPWWCALHYITEATKTIFLELSLGCIHTQDEQANLISLAQKSIRYFEVMSIRSSRARAAWEHFRSIYRRLSLRMSYGVGIMPPMMDTVNPFDLYINNGSMAFEDFGEIDAFNFFVGIGRSG